MARKSTPIDDAVPPSADDQAETPITVVRFVGQDGAHIAGVPMRDLTPTEWAALPAEIAQRALASGVYVLTSVPSAIETEAT